MIGIVIILAAALLLLLREAYARLWSRGVEVTVAVAEPYVYAGEKAHFTEIVANRGKIPLPEIEVRFRMPQGPVFENAENVIISDHLYKRDIFSLRPLEQITRRYVLACPRRGLYPVSDLTVKAKSFFHHRDYDVSQNTGTRLTVYAAWTNVAGILAHCDVILGELESRRKTIEDPFAWASIRAYTPQDPMRSVNWKASARTGELMVNTYASVQAMQFCIFLDARDERIVKQEDLVELGISAAASLSRQLIRRGQEAGLYIYTELPAGQLPPARGQAQLTKIEQALTADYTGVLRRKAGQAAEGGPSKTGLSGDRGQRKPASGAGVDGPEEGPGPGRMLDYAEWAYRTSRAETGECICVYISKEEEALQKLEKLLRTAGNTQAGGQSAPAILVRTAIENGEEKLISRIVY